MTVGTSFLSDHMIKVTPSKPVKTEMEIVIKKRINRCQEALKKFHSGGSKRKFLASAQKSIIFILKMTQKH